MPKEYFTAGLVLAEPDGLNDLIPLELPPARVLSSAGSRRLLLAVTS